MASTHPLDPITPHEFEIVKQVLVSSKKTNDKCRYMSLDLWEPTKADIAAFEERKITPPREARVEIVDEKCEVFWGVVDVTKRIITEWHHVPQHAGKPAFQIDEHNDVERVVKADPRVREAALKRGVTDPERQLMVDCGSTGKFGLPYEKSGKRVCASLLFARALGDPNDNGYAHPLDGIIAIVDVDKMEVLHVEDHTPNPTVVKHNSNYSSQYVEQRAPLKPLDIVQPEGPNFVVNGNHVVWADTWDFRVGFNAREGLVLHNMKFVEQPLNYKGQKPTTIGPKTRPVIFRASMCEMTVPYGDPRPQHFRKNAFDAGEYGLGRCANSLALGCDCKGHIHYFDANMVDSRGNTVVIKNAICMHEEDYGILWKHLDWRTGEAEVRRSRRLVVSFFTTVANYEYGFYWYLYLDGSIHFEAKLTGIVNVGAESTDPAKCPPWGALCGPGGLYALIHQHFFCMRLDMNIDGGANSIYETNYASDPHGEKNQQSNAFSAKVTLLGTEKDAQRKLDLSANRRWKVVNPSKINDVTGHPVGYIIEPGGNTVPYAQPASAVYKRANYITNHLWVTPFDKNERYPTGDFPNQHPGSAGLPTYTAKNRSIVNKDLVVWYIMGVTHDPRPEDWPVMPVAYLGFGLKPHGFFNYNPALNIAKDISSTNKQNGACCAKL